MKLNNEVTKKENSKILLSKNYNRFMLNNYSIITKEEISNKFIKDKSVRLNLPIL